MKHAEDKFELTKTNNKWYISHMKTINNESLKELQKLLMTNIIKDKRTILTCSTNKGSSYASFSVSSVEKHEKGFIRINGSVSTFNGKRQYVNALMGSQYNIIINDTVCKIYIRL